MTRVSSLLGLLVGSTLVLAGCSSSSSDDGAAPSPSGSGSASTSGSTTAAAGATPYLPVPAGVELTEPGSQLSVGDHAVVAYRPRQGQVAALDIDVTALERTTIKDFASWQLSRDQERSTPFYVRARVENVGDTDLGGRPVPLYVVNEDNVLLEPTPFASSFKPCSSTPLPKKFGPGEKTDVCLVYLAPSHGDLVAVSFRPEETFNPITWTGDVQRYEPAKPDAGKGAGKGAQKGAGKKR